MVYADTKLAEEKARGMRYLESSSDSLEKVFLFLLFYYFYHFFKVYFVCFNVAEVEHFLETGYQLEFAV